MKTKTFAPILTSTIIFLAACQPVDRQEAADLVLNNGYIYTVDDSRSVAEAVAENQGVTVKEGGDEKGRIGW